MGNHYIATHPDSPFTTRIIAQKLDDDIWHFLDGTTLTSTYRGGTKQVREHSPTDVPLLLADTFDIALKAEDAAMLVNRLTTRSGAASTGTR